jgi:hypothetical protein
MIRAALTLSGLLVACGGAVVTTDAGDAGKLDSGIADSGFTACSAPAGYKLCGGQCGDSCPRDKMGRGCASDDYMMPDPQHNVGVCWGSGPNTLWRSDCDRCEDGFLCALSSAKLLEPTPAATFQFMDCTVQDWARMFALGGRLDMARYADRSAYTDQPLPTPSTCPSIAGLLLCGGPCGGCQNGFACIGRSPLHPYSVCVNEKGATCQRDVLPSCMDIFADRRCLTFKVDNPSQPVADAHSICVDRAICDAAAQGYPGGAFCTGGK